jgi:hypothetical protein
MRYYMIDDLTAENVQTLAASLKNMNLVSGLESFFWLPVPHGHLSQLQIEHEKSCGPHVMGLELLPDSLRLELLVRARGSLRCECVRYAESGLRSYMMTWLDQCLSDCQIVT